MNARTVVVATVLTCWVELVFGYGVENNAGLRSAERVSPTEIKVVTGAGFGNYRFRERTEAFQVVSPTDRDFQIGVKAASAKITGEADDAEYPAGYAGPRFKKHFLTVALPADRPLKAAHRYWLRVVSPTVLAKNRAGVWITSPGGTPEKNLRTYYGIREIYPVTPDIIHVMTGPGIDLKKVDAITIRSKDDQDFGVLKPIKVGRRSNLDFYIPLYWPWRFHQRHELFLVLPKPMREGKTYTVDFNAEQPVTCGQATADLTLDSRETINLAIKVNQYGYLPDAKEKYGYLGMWAGDLNAIDFGLCAKVFEVRDAETHAAVSTGKIELRRNATYRLQDGKQAPDPKKVKGPETVYKQDLSYEDVYQLDLSALTTPGRYYVAIPGVGRSFTFRIGRDVYKTAFKILMNGLFHQRCGIELKEPYTKHYRPACHRHNTEYATAGIKTGWRELSKFATDGKKHDLCGGHHDAGDWNPRSHLDVAERLFLLYELNPGAFTDGQLNIPEKENGIPDVLDEAWWALRLWNQLQDPDGGVRGKIETNGDPQEFDCAATDRLLSVPSAGRTWTSPPASAATSSPQGPAAGRRGEGRGPSRRLSGRP